MATGTGLNLSSAVDFLQSTIELRTRLFGWHFALLLVLIALVLPGGANAWADGPDEVVSSQPQLAVTSSISAETGPMLASPSLPPTPATTPTPTVVPTPTLKQIGATQTFFCTLGFLFGFFLVYSITVGSKTQDVFKSFLGVAGLGSGILEMRVFPEGVQLDGLVAYGVGAVVGFLSYAVIAGVLCGIYAAEYDPAGPANSPNPLPEKGLALFAAALARTVLGEDLRPPPSVK